MGRKALLCLLQSAVHEQRNCPMFWLESFSLSVARIILALQDRISRFLATIIKLRINARDQTRTIVVLTLGRADLG